MQDYRVWCPHFCASFTEASEGLALKRWNTRHLARQDAEAVCEALPPTVRELLTYRFCASYNDSYFGEPAGLVKRAIADLERRYGTGQRPSPSASEAAKCECGHVRAVHTAYVEHTGKYGGCLKCVSGSCEEFEAKQAERPARQDEHESIALALATLRRDLKDGGHEEDSQLVGRAIAALRSQPVVPLSVARPQPSQGRWAIFYHDVDIPTETFVGDNAEVAARKRYVQARDHWECYLLREVADEPSASQGEAVSEEVINAAKQCAVATKLHACRLNEAARAYGSVMSRSADLYESYAATLSTWAESKT